MGEPEGGDFWVADGPALVERGGENPLSPSQPLPSALELAGIAECQPEEDGDAAEVSPPAHEDEDGAPILEPNAAAVSAIAGGDGSMLEGAVPVAGGEKGPAPAFELDAAADGGDEDTVQEEAVQMVVDPLVFPPAPSGGGDERKAPIFEPDIATSSAAKEEAVEMALDVAEPSAISPYFSAGEDNKQPTFEQMTVDVAEPSAISPSHSAGEDKKAPTFEPDPVAAPAVVYAGHDEEDAKREGAMQDVAGPSALSPSSSSEEDKKAPSFETDGAAESAAALGGNEEEDAQKDEAVQMAECGVESPSSSTGQDEEAPALEPDATAETAVIGGDDDDAEEEAMQMAEDEVLVVPMRRGGGRKKRGRPPKAQVQRPLFRRKEEEEEVCFICFDGGDLVVCDRRGCPKVYHPSCVNRDEAFFRAKGRWNCGWHICSNCEKAAQYMCYTCTYSLCKGCIKGAGFVCVRRNRGFCETCMNTVMLIEKKEHDNDKMDGVDFDDRSSWEYLFKDYWLDLKRKLSLTLEELTRAKTPVKGSDVFIHTGESSDDVRGAPDDQGATNSDGSLGHHDRKSISSRKRLRKRSKKTATSDNSVKEANKGKSKEEKKGKSKEENKGKLISEDVKWASKELLEFVAHMKDGDISVLSQFEVQALLLEYIKQNKLRDPRKKSQIICDSRLQDLFGKSHVGHFEMLKLLESHFLMKEVSPLDTDDHQGGVVDPEPSQIDDEGKCDSSTKTSYDKKRKTRKRVEEKELQANYDDYAAIDVHNITLMYLRRNLMEDLLEDIDSFNEKVVGSFVRIRISGTGQRLDMYRLVQVVGTGNAMEKYRTGKKTTDLTLEILNLDKKEVITIDVISNQEFTEEECKRLRQSIKCGLIGPLTVGEVQDKARALQAVRVNDWLESEKLRLGHLRDRASEKGRVKELRECVEKLQLLSTPEERVRRLSEVPKIHVDPHMDPDYESAEEEEKQDGGTQDVADVYPRPKESSFSIKGRELISPRKGGSFSRDFYIDGRKSSSAAWNSNKGSLTEGVCNVQSSASFGDKANESSWNHKHDVQQTSGWEAPRTQANLAGSESGVQNNNQLGARTGHSSSVPAETAVASLSTEAVVPSNTIESEKLWHYQDPSSKIQGPFSMTQLRKWSTTGYFPSNLRIWKTSEKQEDSILLADALIGKFQKDLPQWEPQQNMANLKAGQSDGSFSLGTCELTKADNQSAPKTLENIPKEERLGTSSRSWGSSNDMNTWSGQTQEQISPKPILPFSSYSNRPRFHQGRGGRGNAGRWNRAQDHMGVWSSNKPSGLRPSHRAYENSHPNWTLSSQQSPGEFRKVQSEIYSSNQSAPQPHNGSGTGAAPVNDSLPSAASIQPIISGRGTNLRGSGCVPDVLNQGLVTEVENGCLIESGSMPKKANMPEINASSQLPGSSTQLKMPPGPESLVIVESKSTNEVPHAVPAEELPEGLDRSVDENRTILVDVGVADPDPVAAATHGTSDMRTLVFPGDNMQSRSSVLVENLSTSNTEKALVEGFEQGVQHSGWSNTNLASGNDGLESASANRLQASFDLKQKQDGSYLKPGLVENIWGQNQFPNQEPRPSSSEPVDTSNSEVPPNNSSTEQLTPTIMPLGWHDGANSMSGFGTGGIIQNTNSGAASQIPNSGMGPAQGNANMIWPTPIQGPMNTGWGLLAQGNMNMAWGTPAPAPAPAPGIANVNMGLGAPPQAIVNMGWVPPVQGNANMNPAWGATTQGNTNVNAVWGSQVQGNSTITPFWGAFTAGNANPNPGWIPPTLGNANQNFNWGAPIQGNMDANAGMGTGQGNNNPTWDPPVGNVSSRNTQQTPAGDGQSGQSDNFHSGDSRQSAGRPLWNGMQSGSGGGSARPPPRGQRDGICRFHENGYCKKGASCNYFHT